MFVESIAKLGGIRPSRLFPSLPVAAAVVLLVGSVLAQVAATYVRETTQAEHLDYFQRRVAEARGILTQHLRMNLEVLRGLQALFVQAGERPVSRDEFRRYAGHLDLEGRYPGIRALSFTRYLRADQLADYESGIRRDPALGRPEFQVKAAGAGPDHFIADFISPANRGDDTMFGVDLGSEAERRATLERARDSGQPTASRLITLTMRASGPTGFFVAAPVYRPGAPVGSVNERRQAFLGCVTAVFGSHEMLTNLFGSRLLEDLDIEIYDFAEAPGHEPYGSDTLLFDSAFDLAGRQVPLHAPAAGLHQTENLMVADRRWSVVFTALPALAARLGGDLLPALTLLGGTTLSLLLFALVAASFNANRRLESLVAERTAELTASNGELAASVQQLTALNQALHNAQNQLMQSEKLASLGQLAAGVAHEINNPISFVNGNIGSLRGYVDDLFAVLDAYEQAEPMLQTYPELLAAIARARTAADLAFVRQDIYQLIAESLDGAQRVKTIVQDLKGFSRLGAAEWHYANLESGLDSTLNIVRHEIKYKAEVVKEYGGIPEVECIGSQINQVFMNLLVNAAQAIDGKGTITIRTGADSAQVWVEIADTGKGMAPEVCRRIFEPFFTTKPVGQGTGLGLSLAYGIIERHHGAITVDSEVGCGSRFRITLPRQRAVAAPAAELAVAD